MEKPAVTAPASGPTTKAKRTALTAAELRLIESRYLGGKTIPEIAAEIDRSWSTVGRRVKALGISRPMGPAPKYPPPPSDRTCRHCGGPITFSSPYYASGRRGRFCSRECFLDHVRTGTVVACPVCGEERYRSASHVRKKCCGYGCHALYRWRTTRAGLHMFVESRRSGRGSWSGPKLREWLGRLTLLEVRAPHKKGEAAARETLALATRAVRQKPQLTRPELLRALVFTLEGRGAVYREDGTRRQGRDPAYRVARRKVERQLQSGFRRFGVPAELARLFPVEATSDPPVSHI